MLFQSQCELVSFIFHRHTFVGVLVGEGEGETVAETCPEHPQNEMEVADTAVLMTSLMFHRRSFRQQFHFFVC